MQIINVSQPNDHLGDPLRDSFIKVNLNFAELLAAITNLDLDIADFDGLQDILNLISATIGGLQNQINIINTQVIDNTQNIDDLIEQVELNTSDIDNIEAEISSINNAIALILIDIDTLMSFNGEDASNKAIDFTIKNNIKYPTTLAVSNYVASENAELLIDNFLDFTSSGQTQLDSKIPLAQKGVANGVATLDSTGKIPTSQIPAFAISETFVVNSQSEMLSLSAAEQGDIAIRTDVNKSYILSQSPASTLSNWKELLTPTDAVQSVDGQTGNVDLSSSYEPLIGYVPANDSNVIHTTGNETKSGVLTFVNSPIIPNATQNFEPVTFIQLGAKEDAFAKNTAFNKNFGTTAGTVAEGNDSRILNGQTAFNWGTHIGLYEPTFSKNTAFNKNFGTTAGTVAEGNHTHIISDVTGLQSALDTIINNADTEYLDKRFLSNKYLEDANTVLDGTQTNWFGGANKPSDTTDGSLLTLAYSSGAFANQMFADWRTNKWFTRSNDGSWSSWKQLAHTDSFDGIYEPVFSKNTAFNKNFGTSSVTVAEGNDSRILNGQTAFTWGNHSGLYYGRSYNGGVIDCNSVTDGVITGFQWINAPITTIASLKTVIYSPDWIEQTFVQIGGYAFTWTRTRYNGTTWSDWKQNWTENNFNPNLKVDKIGGYKTNINDDIDTGFYYIYETTIGIPSGIPDGATILQHIQIEPIYTASQTLFSRDSAIFTRSKINGLWQDWKQLAHTDSFDGVYEPIIGYTAANDDDVVHRTGNIDENIDGEKTFESKIIYKLVDDIYNGIFSTYKSGYGDYHFSSSGFGLQAGLTLKSGSIINAKFQRNGATLFGTDEDNGNGAIVQVNGRASGSNGVNAQDYITKSQLDTKEDTFSKNTAFNKNFGTTAGTVTEGNDARLVEAFAKKVNAISVTGDSNKTITLTREDGTILTATFLDNDTEYPDDVLNTLSFNTNNDGVLIAITSEGEVISVSLDGRYSLLGHTHTKSEVGLSNVDNTADAVKNVLSAVNLKSTLITLAQLDSSDLDAGMYRIEGVDIGTGAGNFHHIIQTGKYSGGGHIYQIAIPFDGGGNVSMYMRSSAYGGFGNWVRMAQNVDITNAINALNLSGTYEPIFSKNTAFNKNFGTTAGTVAEGNDTRIVNAIQNNELGIPTRGGDYFVFPRGSGLEDFDFNLKTGVGFYKNMSLGGSNLNAPFAGGYWSVENLNTWSDRQTQYAHPYRDIDGFWVRNLASGVWSPWVRLDITDLAQLPVRNFSSLTNIPTTLSGFGITDAALDNNVVHKTGNIAETIDGDKTFINPITVNYDSGIIKFLIDGGVYPTISMNDINVLSVNNENTILNAFKSREIQFLIDTDNAEQMTFTQNKNLVVGHSQGVDDGNRLQVNGNGIFTGNGIFSGDGIFTGNVTINALANANSYLTYADGNGTLLTSSLRQTTGDLTTPSTLQMDGTYNNGTGAYNKLKFYLLKDTLETYGFGLGGTSDMQYWAGNSSTGMHRFFTSQIERFVIHQSGVVSVRNLIGSSNAFVFTDGTNGNLQRSSISEDSISIISDKIIVSNTGTDGGFENYNYAVNTHNNIWRFGTAKEYGIGYYQGSSLGTSYDAIGFHFGNRTTPQVVVWQDGRVKIANAVNTNEAVALGQMQSYVAASIPATPSLQDVLNVGNTFDTTILGSNGFGTASISGSGISHLNDDGRKVEMQSGTLFVSNINGVYSTSTTNFQFSLSRSGYKLKNIIFGTSSYAYDFSDPLYNNVNFQLPNLNSGTYTLAIEGGVNTDWIDIYVDLPASYYDYSARYKIKNDTYIFDFKASCNGSAVVGSVSDWEICPDMIGIDPDKLRVIELFAYTDRTAACGITNIKFISNGSSVIMTGDLRDTANGSATWRAPLPIAQF